MSKRLYSAHINADALSVLEELARYRSMFLGAKNSRGQPIGASTLIDEAVVKYVEAHTDEVNQYRKIFDSMKGAIQDGALLEKHSTISSDIGSP